MTLLPFTNTTTTDTDTAAIVANNYTITNRPVILENDSQQFLDCTILSLFNFLSHTSHDNSFYRPAGVHLVPNCQLFSWEQFSTAGRFSVFSANCITLSKWSVIISAHFQFMSLNSPLPFNILLGYNTGFGIPD